MGINCEVQAPPVQTPQTPLSGCHPQQFTSPFPTASKSIWLPTVLGLPELRVSLCDNLVFHWGQWPSAGPGVSLVRMCANHMTGHPTLAGVGRMTTALGNEFSLLPPKCLAPDTPLKLGLPCKPLGCHLYFCSQSSGPLGHLSLLGHLSDIILCSEALPAVGPMPFLSSTVLRGLCVFLLPLEIHVQTLNLATPWSALH